MKVWIKTKFFDTGMDGPYDLARDEYQLVTKEPENKNLYIEVDLDCEKFLREAEVLLRYIESWGKNQHLQPISPDVISDMCTGYFNWKKN